MTNKSNEYITKGNSNIAVEISFILFEATNYVRL
jgi:hypothetical protein